jgi:hypothetical protein
LIVLLLLLPRNARADEEAWVWFENRTQLAKDPRISLRMWTDVRMNRRSDGLAQIFQRVGPLFHVAPWLFVGVHATIYADRLSSGKFDQEARAELEPNLVWRLGDFAFNDRNRLEYRWRESGDRWRYRNQLRVSYAPKGLPLQPFVWDEILIDLNGLGLNQNRLLTGLGIPIGARARVDVGVMARSRKETVGWIHDTVYVAYLFLDVPK